LGFDLWEGCAECEEDFIGPPLTDEDERWWLSARGGSVTIWCSTSCRDNYAERVGMRAIERDLEMGVPDWRDEAMKALKLK